MEAMRLSLLEHEEQQRKQREEVEKKRREQGGDGEQSGSPAPLDTTSATSAGAAASPSNPLASSTPITPTGETFNSSNSSGTPSAPIPVPVERNVPSPVSAASSTPEGIVQPQTPPSAMSTTQPVPLDRADSIASSMAPGAGRNNYDVLSSSPESTVSHKPLLHSRPPSPPQPQATSDAA